MKSHSIAIFLAAYLLFLAAHAGFGAAPPAEREQVLSMPTAAAEYQRPDYAVTPVSASGAFRAKDGKREVASYSCQTLRLSLKNPEELSQAEREAGERNIAAFNTKMEAVQEDLVRQGEAMASDALAAWDDFGSLTASYEDEAAMDGVFCGDILSACLYRWSYTGGAHPNSYADSYLFDLRIGQFIDPTQVAEDPEAFRAGAAELLLEKAEAHGERESFWKDYADVIARWNEGTVQFTGEGMRVIYSPYELGPYSVGEVELLLTYEELTPLLGAADRKSVV